MVIFLFTGKRLEKIFSGAFSYSSTYICVTIRHRGRNLFVQIEFPSIKISSFDAESNSASNGGTFIYGKTNGKNFLRDLFLVVDISVTDISSRENFFHSFSRI